ncbi:hypothetical protein O0L34_g19429 [Tuta absoluta]|nr:hypothetical protein O0L34_g19429 [Tuta absoluta]
MSAVTPVTSSEFYYSQEPLVSIEESYMELRNKEIQENTTRKKKKSVKKVSKTKTQNKSFDRRNNELTYIKSRSNKKGHHLIKIKVYDISGKSSMGKELTAPATGGDDSDDEAAVLSAQYVAYHPVDEILDETEYLVNKISKTLGSRNAM